MENNTEELSIDEVLSSIREAVLETKTPEQISKEESKEDIFVLTEDMLAKNVATSALNEKDFSSWWSLAAIGETICKNGRQNTVHILKIISLETVIIIIWKSSLCFLY